MKKYLQSGMCALVVLAAPLRGDCSSIVTAHVLSFGTYGNGNVYIALDQTIDQPGCNAPYLEFVPSDAATKALATAALAVATGAPVQVEADACLNSVPTFSGARSAWFLVFSN